MRRFLLSAIAAVLLAGPVIAADMRVKPRAYVPPPAFSWTGCYLGAFAGGAWSDGADFTDLGNTTHASYSGGTTASKIVPSHSWGVGDSGGSFSGGGTLGCNWQPVASSPFVLGLEGELGYLRLRGSTFDPNTVVGIQNTLDVLGSATVGNWYGMITGRIGYAFDRILIYVKGGAAFVRTQASVLDQCAVPNSATPGCGNWLISTSGSETPAAGTIGGGLEWAFGQNWSVKGEYMFIGLHNGFQTSSLSTLASGNVVPGGPFVFNHHFNGINTVKVGLNYRFNWGGNQIATRY